MGDHFLVILSEAVYETLFFIIEVGGGEGGGRWEERGIEGREGRGREFIYRTYNYLTYRVDIMAETERCRVLIILYSFFWVSAAKTAPPAHQDSSFSNDNKQP